MMASSCRSKSIKFWSRKKSAKEIWRKNSTIPVRNDRQIVTFESWRGEKMFERYGFKVLNRAEITKYKAFYPESVYLSTVIKNLEMAEPLSVTSRSRS
jgi:hypothetical protein